MSFIDDQMIGDFLAKDFGYPDFPVDGALCRATNDRVKG